MHGALILTQEQVLELLPPRDCIQAVEEALCALARGRGQNPLRRGMRVEEPPAILGMMPGALGAEPGEAALGLKVVAVFPGNHGTPLDSHQGLVMLFDPRTGVPLAILEASSVTARRTAAASALATRVLARDDARDLALIGSGVQARYHLEAIACVRDLARVRVYSPTRANREAFARRESREAGIAVEPVGSAREAVLGADIVCTVTSSAEPVLEGEWLAPGTHVNAAGASVASARELDVAAVARASLFVDRRESTFNESGDYLHALREGAIGEDHVRAELGEVLTGARPGRRSREEVTLFKSLGLAVEDLAAARLVYARALERGVGTRVPLAGLKA